MAGNIQNRWHDRQQAQQAKLKQFPKAGDILFSYGLEKPGFAQTALLTSLNPTPLPGAWCTTKLWPMVAHEKSKVIAVSTPDKEKHIIGVANKIGNIAGLTALLEFYGGLDHTGFTWLMICPYDAGPPPITSWESPKRAWMITSKWLLKGNGFAELKAPQKV